VLGQGSIRFLKREEEVEITIYGARVLEDAGRTPSPRPCST